MDGTNFAAKEKTASNEKLDKNEGSSQSRNKVRRNQVGGADWRKQAGRGTF